MISVVLSLILATSQEGNNSTIKADNCQQKTITLDKYRLPNDSIMCKIMADVKKDLKLNINGYLKMTISRYKGGHFVKVSHIANSILPRGFWIGYSVVGNDTIVINHIEDDYYEKFELCNESRDFTISNDKKEPSTKVEEDRYFFIIKDKYAKYTCDNSWEWVE